MIRVKDTRHQSTAEFLNAAIRIAEYYGFSPLEEMKPLRLSEQDKKRVQTKNEQEISFARKEERALASAAKRAAGCATLSPEGVLAWRVTQHPSLPAVSLELHVVGSSSAIAEALLLVVASAIADDAGVGERSLHINNLGSHESSNRFVRDVGSYLRKHLETISPTLRPRAAVDPLGTLVTLVEKGHPAAPRAPQPMEYLTEEERRKFWELLEYLETYGLAYELSPQILGSRDCWAHALYEIRTQDQETGDRVAVAFGGRYDPLATRFAPAHTPAAMISITCETRGKTTPKREKLGMPSIYYAHLGPEARRKSLVLLETLRRNEIPVHQSLLFERIGDQMARAKQLATPYVMIMGYKEAMEDTVLVREVSTNSQEAIPTGEVVNYLRRRRAPLSLPSRA